MIARMKPAFPLKWTGPNYDGEEYDCFTLFFLKLSVDSAAWKALYFQMEQSNFFIKFGMPLPSYLACKGITIT